eukprot:COSAG06_NODE_301_length_17881_cov_19.286976_13_plen_455_part_00
MHAYTGSCSAGAPWLAGLCGGAASVGGGRAMVGALASTVLAALFLFATRVAATTPFPAPQPPFGPFAPPFPSTWSLAGSTVIQAGRKDNWMNASAAAKYGILSIDWANYRRGWDPKTHALPANDGCMATQAQQIKAQGTTTKVYVYRNVQQALAIESSCYAVMKDERYAGLFLRCKDGSIYHRGASAKTGACRGPLNGSDPWAIFFWDFRNKSAQTYFLDKVVGGPNGIGEEYIDGVFLDDAGPGTRTAPMPEYRNQLLSAAAHIGMSDEEIVELSNATHEMLVNLRAVLYQKGKGVWLSSGDPSWFDDFDSHCTGNQTTCNWWSAPTAGETCTQFYASLCRQDLNGSGFTYNPNSHHHPWSLPEELGWHLAVGTFLLLRGELAWLMTSSWYDGRFMLWDPSLDLEVGEPTGTCAQKGSVFSRTWSLGRVKIDCKDLSVQLDFASNHTPRSRQA